MISFILISLLQTGAVGDYWKPKMPEPYLGFHVAAFPDRIYTQNGSSVDTITRHKKFISLAAPFEFYSLEVQDLRPIPMIFLPEVFLHQNLVMFNLAVGPELNVELSKNFYPSGMFGGVQGGFFGLWYFSPGTHHNDDDREFTPADQFSYGFLLNTYFGPSFDILGKFLFKLQFNPKFYFGNISRHTMRISNTKFAGMTFGINLQVQGF